MFRSIKIVDISVQHINTNATKFSMLLMQIYPVNSFLRIISFCFISDIFPQILGKLYFQFNQFKYIKTLSPLRAAFNTFIHSKTVFLSVNYEKVYKSNELGIETLQLVLAYLVNIMVGLGLPWKHYGWSWPTLGTLWLVLAYPVNIMVGLGLPWDHNGWSWHTL